jgi:hypothetical protein
MERHGTDTVAPDSDWQMPVFAAPVVCPLQPDPGSSLQFFTDFYILPRPAVADLKALPAIPA